MYDELVKRLHQRIALTHAGSPLQDDLQQAADAIEELQQIAAHYEETAKDYFKDVCYYLERVPKWIPVTERLPKESERVLVACEDGVSFGFFEEIIADDEFVKEWHDMMYYPISVTHWMPLPSTEGLNET